MIKAIFFDFDDTLGDRVAYATDCYREILEEYGGTDDPVLLEMMIQDCVLWDEFGTTQKTYVQEMLARHYQINLPFENFTDYWIDHQWHHVIPFEDCEETLRILSGRYKLGIISNGRSDAQRLKLETSGLAGYFPAEHIIVSGDYDFAKPDPRIFLEACRRLDVLPKEAVHVGDIYSKDIAGALRAGLQPVWMTRQSRRRGGGDVLKIEKIKELLLYF